MQLTTNGIKSFRGKVYDYYHKHGRNLPWRKTHNPYHIVVSEIMLQQTHVERVIQKYQQFIKAFPNFSALAKAPLQKVLRVWQGMGYNRRALFLKKIAEIILKQFNNKLPKNIDNLAKLPGIGKHTAASICAFAFNQPTLFIETNIRAVFIQEFFNDRTHVNDAEILPLVEQTLDKKNPCKWYNALMDYGVMIKAQYKNPARKSAHYMKQSPFEGSNRQIRGAILKLLTQKPRTNSEIKGYFTGMRWHCIDKNLTQLKTEGFVSEQKDVFSIAS